MFKSKIKAAIDKLITFCNNSTEKPLWPNGPTGEEYLQGLVRVDEQGENRGSFIPGLTNLSTTLQFLLGLDWMPVVVSEEAKREGCEYYSAELELASAFIGVIAMKDARALGLEVKAVGSKHGTEFHAQSNGYLQQTTTITLIIEDGMMSTWHPGDPMPSIPREIPVNPSNWDENWPVKLV